MKNKKHLRLKSKAIVYIDWANVHGWTKSIKREVDPNKLYRYLKSYKETREIKFYFGTDKNSKSRDFINKVRNLGYRVRTKPVKYIVVARIKREFVTKRKCDFDVEIVMDVYADLEKNVESFIFFTGDGDFEPLYKFLVNKGKQVIVVYASGHIGREILKIEKKIFLFNVEKLLREDCV